MPSWQAECSKAHNRGLHICIEASMIATGTVIAYWIGRLHIFSMPSPSTDLFSLRFRSFVCRQFPLLAAPYWSSDYFCCSCSHWYLSPSRITSIPSFHWTNWGGYPRRRCSGCPISWRRGDSAPETFDHWSSRECWRAQNKARPYRWPFATFTSYPHRRFLAIVPADWWL